MTKQDMDGLWKLLGIYRPKDPRLEDKTLKAAWLLVLEPYSPDDVRQAVAAYFRGSGFWPDVSDIATRCPPPPEQDAVLERSASTGRADPRVREWWEEFRAGLRAAGLPTASEAKAQGMTAAEWGKLLEEAGL